MKTLFVNLIVTTVMISVMPSGNIHIAKFTVDRFTTLIRTNVERVAITAAYLALLGALSGIVAFVLSVTGGLGSDII